MTRTRRNLMLLGLAAVGTAAAFGAAQALERQRHDRLVTSCVSNGMVSLTYLRGRTAGGGAVRLPATMEYNDFLDWTGLLKEGMGEGFPCPARKEGGPATGIVFVGGGLPLRGPPRTLIAFCADENHAPDPTFQAAMTLDQCRTWSRAEVAELIERALTAAADGSVPYSPEAVAVLKTELQKRRRPY